MKYLILVASLALAGNALAEGKPKNISKPLDKSSPVLMTAEPTPDSTETADAKEKANKTKSSAQDYNSSRSNNSSSVAPQPENVVHRDVASRSAEASDFGMSRATERRAPVANQNTSRSNHGGVAASPPAEGADYNSSRSNKTHAPASGDRAAGEPGGTRAQDYNSSRSNNTTSLRDNDAADLDGDGRPDLVVCEDGVDRNSDAAAENATTGVITSRKGYDYNCNKADTAAAPASPASPANHNTTRSNR